MGDLLKDDITSRGTTPSPLGENSREGTSQLHTSVDPFTPCSNTPVVANWDVTLVNTLLHSMDNGKQISVIDLSDNIVCKRRKETPDRDYVVGEAILTIDTLEGEPSKKCQCTTTAETLLANNVTNVVPMTKLI